jgi:hypothetical protein
MTALAFALGLALISALEWALDRGFVGRLWASAWARVTGLATAFFVRSGKTWLRPRRKHWYSRLAEGAGVG